MILSTAWKGQRYAVLGLARSGMATVRALAAAGAYVVAWDSDPAARERAQAIDGVIVHDPAASTSPARPGWSSRPACRSTPTRWSRRRARRACR